MKLINQLKVVYTEENFFKKTKKGRENIIIYE